MKLLVVTFLAIFLFIPDTAQIQVVCFGYSGGMISCDSSRGNTLITPLSPSQGIIQDDRHGESFLEPYTIIGQPDRRESYSSREESFSSRPIEPLRQLDQLDRLDRSFSRHDDDLLLPLLLAA